ncbi:hypothetical protein BN946_scf184851.g55 [Trametes cinnabarina]|uniref:Zn(2)-C6 fungal-type domain-containing protein n=1 Tax=Pycnoporus cinnabarinus TaxID=5643 RepID=A0A060S5E6_PYCCI|nr:hypothetical protein BN946_scf184851.g55 [Trametes cinnabarina]
MTYGTMSSLIQPPCLLRNLFYTMDRRQQDHDEATQTPQQQTPDEVLLWIDSLSGHAPGDPAVHYNWPVGEWPPDATRAPYRHAGAHESQQGSFTLPPGTTRGQPSFAQTGQPYMQTAYAGQPYPQTIMFSGQSQGEHVAYEEHSGSYRGSSPSYTETESVCSSSKGKSRIALDPSQPLTVDGKPRARVFVACDRCRVRKLRCDGAKPACYNCQKVAHTDVQCIYDREPKRRGQDKAPRTRSAVGQRKPRRPASKKGEPPAPAPGQSDYPGAYEGA